MAEIIQGGSELIRIGIKKGSKSLEYSKDGGRNWYTRFSGSGTVGNFVDLLDHGDEILAVSTEGIFYSKDSGRNWYRRFRFTSSTGEFQVLQSHGNELLAQSTKGLFYSKDEGRNWYRRR